MSSLFPFGVLPLHYFWLICVNILSYFCHICFLLSPLLCLGKEVQVVWACDENIGGPRRNDGDGNERTTDKGERKA